MKKAGHSGAVGNAADMGDCTRGPLFDDDLGCGSPRESRVDGARTTMTGDPVPGAPPTASA